MHKPFKIKKTGDSYILYDADIIAEPVLPLFDRDYHTNSEDRQNNSALASASGIGRAQVVYFAHENIKMVLKHYFRGGLVASVLSDQYLGFDIEKTRAFKEWRLLKKMQALALPVPVAVAARVKKGLFYYRADLITREIESVQTLAALLNEQAVEENLWKKIGACIKDFHQKNIYHADLNARNILLTQAGDVYLIDFDNSGFRADATSWKRANLARLKRSLLKFQKQKPGFHFTESNWQSLLQGYRA